MLKLSLVVLFVMSLATLAIAASAMPVPPAAGGALLAQAAELG